ALDSVAEPERRRRLRLLQAEAESASSGSLVGEDELKWRTTTGIRISRLLLCHTAAALPRELLHAVNRLRGRYDTAVADPPRLRPPSTTLTIAGPSGPCSAGREAAGATRV
ncbi:MAG: hypothetical protein QOH29_198, partial [Actinomycetota bacterium]|nr:hypothetical protein [Actinomycetota bacterium]